MGLDTVSHTVCRCLAARQASTRLLPAAPRDRALVGQWMDWQATELNDAWRTAFFGPPPGRAHPSSSGAGKRRPLEPEKMRTLDEQLARTGGHVVGEQATVADVALGLSSHCWKATPIDHLDLPTVAAHGLRLQAQPGFSGFVDNGMP